MDNITQHHDVNLNNIDIHIEESQSGALSLIISLLEWKKFIFIFVLVTTLLAVGVSLILPKWYKAKVSLLLPKNQSYGTNLGGLTALLKEVAPGASGKLGNTSSYSYLAILNSRKAEEQVIRQFNLMSVYDIKSNLMEDAIQEFNNNYAVEVTEHGTIDIVIMDKDSVRASKMANYLVSVLNEISIDLGISEARENREFLEARVLETKDKLRNAEDSLKTFQEEFGMLFLPEDAKATAQSVAELFRKKMQVDIQLSITGKTLSSDHPRYQNLLIEKAEIDKRLSKFPELGLESYRLYRSVIIQQKILEFLIPLHEQAKIEEHKEVPVVLVLDKAVPAEKKSRPQRTLIVVSAFLSSTIFSVVIVLGILRFRHFKHTNTAMYQKLMYSIRKR